MPDRRSAVRAGRRGRRTSTMIRVAHERISDLFGLAEAEVRGGNLRLSDRYVRIARRIGMRYNVRLMFEYRELYCRGCSAYWVEGRTVRTRLRGGRRVRVCLICGRIRRIAIRFPRSRNRPVDTAAPRALKEVEPLLADEERPPARGVETDREEDE